VHGQGCVRAARFDVLRCRRNEVEAFLYAFDLLELDGTDLRREPIETRKATLASVLPLAEGQDHAPQPGAGHRWRD
jgi:ATP-dependent DNA ligase